MAALAAEPSHAGALAELGVLYRGCGLLPEAAAALRAAAAVRPDDAAVQQALAVVLTDLGAILHALVSPLCASLTGILDKTGCTEGPRQAASLALASSSAQGGDVVKPAGDWRRTGVPWGQCWQAKWSQGKQRRRLTAGCAAQARS